MHTNNVATHDERTSCNRQGRLLGATTQTTGMVRTKNQSCTWRACCQPVLKGHTPGEPNTIFLHVLCSGHCACSTHSLHHHRRRQIPTSTTPFVCTCASLLARTMPLPARALFSRRPDTCLLVPCLCRVRSVARVCHVITSGDPHTNPLRVSCSAHCTCYVHHTRCFRWLLSL